MPNVTRITSNGTFYTANTIDEISYNPSVAFGKNLFRASQNYSTNWWVRQSTTVVNNLILGPDERTFATKVVGDSGVTSRKSIYQSVTLQGKVKYTFSVYVKEAGFSNVMLWFDSTPPGFLDEGAYYGAGDLINIIDGTKTGGQTNPVINVGNGWYRISVSATPRWNMTIGLNLSLGEANGNGTKVGDGFSGVYLWNPQIEIGTVATDPVLTNDSGVPVPNFSFKTTNIGNYYARSYIDEVSQNRNAINKNLLTWSQDFTQSDWSKVNGFMQTGFLAPNETLTAQKFTESAGTIYRQFYRGVSSALYNQVYTISCYYKPSGRFRFNMGYGNQAGLGPDRTVQVNLNTNTITTSDSTIIDRGIIPVNDGWYRVYATFITPGSGFLTVGTIVGLLDSDGQFVFTGDGSSGILMWGAQLELGTLSDYVQTGSTTAPVTNFVKRDTANGVSMVSSEFDERNGVLDQVVDSSLIVNLDAAKPESYPGSGTTWFDTTPNRNDMTIYNFTVTSVSSNLTWDYNSQSFLALGNNFGTSIQGIANATINTPSFSIEIWSRVRSFNAGDFNLNMISGRGNFLLHGHRMGYNAAGGLASATTGSVGFYSVYNGGNISLTSSTISINTWYQTVITFDDTRKFARFYVNGVLVASQDGAVYTMPQQPAWTSGPSAFTNGQGCASINGNIGNFMYYNRPLTASEVSQNYSAIRGRYGI